MKKNPEFENWIAGHLPDSVIVMKPYGYREEEPGKFLHIFRISLKFDDVPDPFTGVAFIPIRFEGGSEAAPNFTFSEENLDFLKDFIVYD